MFTSFIKREFGKFHVVVTQRRQRNEQKTLYTYKASCCFVVLVAVAGVVLTTATATKTSLKMRCLKLYHAYYMTICTKLEILLIMTYIDPSLEFVMKGWMKYHQEMRCLWSIT